MSENYLLPPMLIDATGQPRRAGFEFEFGNLPVVETAKALQEALGGELDIESPFEVVLRDSSLGRLKIERDAELLKSQKYRKWLETLGIEFSPGTIAHEIETNIDSASRTLVPCEVVTDPIPFGELAKLDILTKTLNSLGAEGTQDSVRYAFGLHINPSVPDSSGDTLRRYMQAFLLLHAWIIESSDIDITRRFFTKYIDPFPQPYLDMVLERDYRPDTTHFIVDYLAHNPTRNRALDMLPIFYELEPELVFNEVFEDERSLLSGRPAFHYRLPDCKLNEPGWNVSQAWDPWVYIEVVATDEDLLGELIDAWREASGKFTLAPTASWALALTTILSRKFLLSQYE